MTKDDSNKEIIFSENIPETNIEPSEKLEFNFLRPKSFTDYIGQNKIIESLSIAVEASRKRD